MHIGICEDEKIYAKMLNDNIDDFFASNNKKCSQDLIDNYTPLYDVLFLDIMLPDINGMEVAKKIREIDKDVIIVFLTSMPDFVYEGYEVNAFRYILKDKINDDFNGILNSLNDEIESFKTNQTENIIIKKRNEQIILKITDIIYITSYLRKLIFCTREGNHEIYAKLSDYDFLEKKSHFIKCHNAYLVNIEHITSFDKANIYLSEKFKIPVSNAYRKNATDIITAFVNKRSEF